MGCIMIRNITVRLENDLFAPTTCIVLFLWRCAVLVTFGNLVWKKGFLSKFHVMYCVWDQLSFWLLFGHLLKNTRTTPFFFMLEGCFV